MSVTSVFDIFLKTVKLLVQHGAKIHSKSVIGRTALYAACAVNHNNFEIIKLLIEFGSDINAKDCQLGKIASS